MKVFPREFSRSEQPPFPLGKTKACFPLDFRFALVGVEASLFITNNLNIVVHVYSDPYANGNCLI